VDGAQVKRQTFGENESLGEMRARPDRYVVLAVLVAAVLAACTGCASSSTSSTSPTSPATPAAPTSTPSVVPTAPSYPAVEVPSAIELGGVSHKGEPLYLVVASIHDRQQEASAALAAMTTYFGDADVFYTVQRSNAFEGLESGRWVVAEAYWTRDAAQSGLEWATGRGPATAPFAPVLRLATARSDDPVPVVEDVMYDERPVVNPTSGPLVEVPDALGAIRKAHLKIDYWEDPDGAAAEIMAVVRTTMLRAGLLSSFEFRSIVLEDEQTPPPGTMVPKGTIVRTRFGIGD